MCSCLVYLFFVVDLDLLFKTCKIKFFPSRCLASACSTQLLVQDYALLVVHPCKACCLQLFRGGQILVCQVLVWLEWARLSAPDVETLGQRFQPKGEDRRRRRRRRSLPRS